MEKLCVKDAIHLMMENERLEVDFVGRYAVVYGDSEELSEIFEDLIQRENQNSDLLEEIFEDYKSDRCIFIRSDHWDLVARLDPYKIGGFKGHPILTKMEVLRSLVLFQEKKIHAMKTIRDTFGIWDRINPILEAEKVILERIEIGYDYEVGSAENYVASGYDT